MPGAHEALALVGLGQVVTLFFVTLGPLKILGPFAQLTREADEVTTRKIAVRAFVIAVIAVVVGGFLGRALAENWSISEPALLLSGGIIFALVGLSLVNSPDAARTANVLAIVPAVMVLNLLAMLYARRIMGGITVMVLQILGAVLGGLQVALAVEMILRALHELGVLPG